MADMVGTLSGKPIQRIRRFWEHCRSGYLRVWLQSKLFPPPPKGNFPPVGLASVRAYPPALKTDDRPHALLAVGGSLSEESLISAYAKGIYPMCYEHPIRWIVFNPRMVLFPERMRIERGWKKLIRSGRYRVTFDTAFEEVLRRCTEREWTWLVAERMETAKALHKRGQAHSVEVWNKEGELVGGQYGVDMGRFYVAESAFSTEKNVIHVGHIHLVCHLQHWGYRLVDAQVYSNHHHLEGFEEIPREEYGRLLRELAKGNIRHGPWKVDDTLDVAAWVPAEPGSQLRDGRSAESMA